MQIISRLECSGMVNVIPGGGNLVINEYPTLLPMHKDEQLGLAEFPISSIWTDGGMPIQQSCVQKGSLGDFGDITCHYPAAIGTRIRAAGGSSPRMSSSVSSA